MVTLSYKYFQGNDLRAGSVCSLVGVILHTALMMESSGLDIEHYINNAMMVLVPFTMAQHFNVRLHAQVSYWH